MCWKSSQNELHDKIVWLIIVCDKIVFNSMSLRRRITLGRIVTVA
jgi:hypothetical protein